MGGTDEHDPRQEPLESRVQEHVAVVLLSLMAVLTAWCGFQSAKWRGEMSVAFSQAGSARVWSVDKDGEARDQRAMDLAVYTQWVLARANRERELTEYIEARFSPAFEKAFDAWQADGMRDRGPFVREEYVPPGTREAEALSARADERFTTALDRNARADRYSLLTVVFALVLFLTALSQRGLTQRASRALLGMALVIGLAGLGVMATFPVNL